MKNLEQSRLDHAAKLQKQFGEHYTPESLSTLMTRLIQMERPDVNSVYDPTCGAGSLLHNFGQHADEKTHLYGQEIHATEAARCRKNLAAFPKVKIASGDTLTAPAFEDHTFDAVISNPPFSTAWDRDAVAFDPRFTPAGVLPPKSKADWAFGLHVLSVLAETGWACVVMFPGALYRQGAEAAIREYFVRLGAIKAVIQLPDTLFLSTSISVTLLVMAKQNPTQDILFVHAGELGEKIGKRNIINDDLQAKILEVVQSRASVPQFARVVPVFEIADNGFSLTPGAYVDTSPPPEPVDIAALNEEVREAHRRLRRNTRKWDMLIEWAESGFEEDPDAFREKIDAIT